MDTGGVFGEGIPIVEDPFGRPFSVKPEPLEDAGFAAGIGDQVGDFGSRMVPRFVVM